MGYRFARPTRDTLARTRSERDAFMAQARADHDAAGDQARNQQRKMVWAPRTPGLMAPP